MRKLKYLFIEASAKFGHYHKWMNIYLLVKTLQHMTM